MFPDVEKVYTLRVDPPDQTPAWARHHGESTWSPVWGHAAVTVLTYCSWTLSRSLQLSRVWLPYLLSWNSSKHEADHTVWQKNSPRQLINFTNRGCDASIQQQDSANSLLTILSGQMFKNAEDGIFHSFSFVIFQLSDQRARDERNSCWIHFLLITDNFQAHLLALLFDESKQTFSNLGHLFEQSLLNNIFRKNSR